MGMSKTWLQYLRLSLPDMQYCSASSVRYSRSLCYSYVLHLLHFEELVSYISFYSEYTSS